MAALGLLVWRRHVLALTSNTRIGVVQIRHRVHLLLFSSIDVILRELLTLCNLLLNGLQVADDGLQRKIWLNTVHHMLSGSKSSAEPVHGAAVSELRPEPLAILIYGIRI